MSDIPIHLFIKNYKGGFDKLEIKISRTSPFLESPKTMSDFIFKTSFENNASACSQCGILTNRSHDSTTFAMTEKIIKYVISFWFPCCMSKTCTDVNIESVKSSKIMLKSINKDFILQRQCCQCSKIDDPTELKFMVCSRCKIVYYCSQECQKLDWQKHKLFCKK
jgi:hypothetical protein